MLHHFIYRFDPTHEHLAQGIRTGIAATLGIVVYYYCRAFPESFWPIIFGALLIQTRVGTTLKEQMLSVLLCSLITIALSMIATITACNMWLQATFIGLVGVIVVLVARNSITWLIRSFFILVLTILASGIPLAQPIDIIYRLGFMCAGIIVVLVTSLVLLECKQVQCQKAIKAFLYVANKFACALCRESMADTIDDDAEELFHHFRHSLLLKLNLIRTLSDDEVITNHAEQLWQTIIALGNFRHIYQDQERISIFHYIQCQLKNTPNEVASLDADVKNTIDQLINRHHKLITQLSESAHG